MLMFMLPEDVDRVRAVITRYAREEDHHELKSEKARRARFHAEAIDPDKGSATGYVAKYISKNIDGYALDDERDDESGEMLKETPPAVSAWAARCRIRQFQFVGGAPVTVYRELRRMADAETAKGLSVGLRLCMMPLMQATGQATLMPRVARLCAVMSFRCAPGTKARTRLMNTAKSVCVFVGFTTKKSATARPLLRGSRSGRLLLNGRRPKVLKLRALLRPLGVLSLTVRRRLGQILQKGRRLISPGH